MKAAYIIFLFTITSFSQNEFNTNIVVDDINLLYGPTFVVPADINGDGNIDLIHSDASTISWSKNIGSGFYLNGNGDENYYHRFDKNYDYYVSSIFPTDIDNDGDVDVIVGLDEVNKVVWYKNRDGLGDFGDNAPIVISTLTDGIRSVFAADIDNDGDMDVISASTSYPNVNKIVWHENTDGLGNFGTQRIISTKAYGVESVFAGDIDGDGDIDIVSALFFSSNTIVWYKNLDGMGNFGSQQVILNDSISIIGSKQVILSDIDNDGDLDVVASIRSNSIAWFENLNGEGDFGEVQIISEDGPDTESIAVNDIDSDGYLDVISLNNNQTIAWSRNIDGEGNFGVQQIIANNIHIPRCVATADINNDGAIDVISAAAAFNTGDHANRIAWYENNLSLNVAEQNDEFFSIYPNPTKNFVNINSKSEIQNVNLYNQLGQLVLSNVSKNKNTFDISTVSEGIYFLRIQNVKGDNITKKILKM